MRPQLAVLAILLASVATAAELRVPSQFGSIQEAVGAAANGDAVVVAPGTYHESIDLLGKKITLRSSGGAAVTILDGSTRAQSIVTARRGESLETAIEGFTFRNGPATRTSVCGYPNVLLGGGVFLLNGGLTIRDSVFENNGRRESDGRHMIAGGGAVFACQSDLAVTGTRFENNGSVSGGAIEYLGNGARRATIRNSTFRNNDADGGGSISAYVTLVSSLTVLDCEFEGDNAAHGGSIWYYGINRARMTIERSTFRGSRAAHGAGVKAGVQHAASVTIHGCRFDDHVASHGAGAHISATDDTHVIVSDSRFANGKASSGGGVFVSANYNAIVDILRSDFTGHEAGFGGGLYAQARGNVPQIAGAQIRVTGCRFLDNAAHAYADTGTNSDACFTDGPLPSGDGFYYGGGADLRTLTGGSIALTNCLFAGNNGTRGGGAHAGSCAGGEIEFVNCTVVENGADGLHVRLRAPRAGGATGSGTIRVHNSIVRENAGPEIIVDQLDPGARAIVTFNNIERGLPGEGNIDVAPAFVDAAAGDFRLSPGSPCIDAGNNEVLEDGIRTDLAGRIRFADDPATRDRGAGGAPQVDLGAHEFQPDPGEPRRRPSRR